MNFKNTTLYLRSRNSKFNFEILFLLNQFYFYRMLEKDPDRRIDINEVDNGVKRINFKTADVIKGKLPK